MQLPSAGYTTVAYALTISLLYLLFFGVSTCLIFLGAHFGLSLYCVFVCMCLFLFVVAFNEREIVFAYEQMFH